MSNSNTQLPGASQPIAAPANFSVDWVDPQDAKVTWMLNEKYKTPIPPLIHAVVAAFLLGNGAGFQRAGLPMSIRVARFNTYQYFGMAPTAAPPEAVMKAMGLLNRAAPGVFKRMMGMMAGGMSKKQEDALNPIVDRFEAYWNEDLLPEI
jgi:hypothetical protein